MSWPYSPLLTGTGILGGTGNAAPSVSQNTPLDAGTVTTTTPALVFTGTDGESEDISYEVQVSTDASFVPSAGGTFGKTNVGSLTDESAWPFDEAYSFIYTAPETGKINKVSLYIKTTSGTAGIRAAIYSVVAGVPTDLLAKSSVVTISTTNQWYEFPLATQVLAGQQYAIAYGESDTDVEFTAYRETNEVYLHYQATPILDQPWSESSTWQSAHSIYATYDFSEGFVGNNQNEDTGLGNGADSPVCIKVNVPVAFSYEYISAFVRNTDTSSHNIQVAIYSDNSGSVGTLISSSSSTVVAAGHSGWKKVPMTGTLSVGTYWLCVNTDYSGIGFNYGWGGLYGATYKWAETFGSWSNNPTTTFTDSGINMSIYAGGGSFPTIESVTDTDIASSLTSHVIGMPATVSAGDRLIALTHYRNAGTWTTVPTGWSKIAEQAGGGSVGEMAIFEKVADGTEGSSTATWVTDTATTAAWQVLRVSGAHDSQVSAVATSSGDSTNADPPGLVPSWQDENTLWIAVAGHSASSAAAFTAAPAEFGGFALNGASSGGSACTIAHGYIQENTRFINPTTFDASGSNRWWASATIAIRPATVLAGYLIDKVSDSDTGFSGTPDNTDPFTSGQAVTYTIQAADELVSGNTYYWRVRGKDPAGGNSYGLWSATRSFTVDTSSGATPVNVQKSAQYSIKYTPTAKTKSLAYSVKVTASALTKGLIYRVKTTPSAQTKSLQYQVKATASITKSLKYTVKTTTAAVTKSLRYAVKVTQTATTKALAYTVKSTPSATTKALTYRVKVTAAATKSLQYAIKTTHAALTKSLSYQVKATLPISKSLAYMVKTTISGVTKSLSYQVKTSSSITKSLQYVVINSSSIQVTKSLAYAVKVTSSITKALQYMIRATPSAVTKSLAYRVKTTSTAVTKTLIYAVKPSLSKTKSLAYSVVVSGSSTKSLVYKVKPTVAITKSLRYTVTAHVSAITKTLAYQVTGTPSAVTKGMVYAVKETKAAITKGLIYAVRPSSSITKSLNYIVSQATLIFKSLKYTVKTSSSINKSLQYSVVNTNTPITKSLQYSVTAQAAAITKSLQYRVHSQGSPVTKSLRYAIATTASVTKALNYSIAVSHPIAKTLSYAIKVGTIATKTLRYVIVGSSISVSKPLSYAVKYSAQVTKSLSYRVRATAAAKTESLTYRVRTNAVPNKSLRYAVKANAIKQKALSYRVTRAVASTQKAIRYAVKAKTIEQKSLVYSVKRPHAAVTKGLTYVVFDPTTRYSVTKVLSYFVTLTEATSKPMTYRVRTSRYPYTDQDGPYSKTTPPYTSAQSPYNKTPNPYSGKVSAYSRWQ